MNQVFLYSTIAWTETKSHHYMRKNGSKVLDLVLTIGFKNGLLSLVYGLGTEIGQPFCN